MSLEISALFLRWATRQGHALHDPHGDIGSLTCSIFKTDWV